LYTYHNELLEIERQGKLCRDACGDYESSDEFDKLQAELTNDFSKNSDNEGEADGDDDDKPSAAATSSRRSFDDEEEEIDAFAMAHTTLKNEYVSVWR
jgi:hypothetical protein